MKARELATQIARWKRACIGVPRVGATDGMKAAEAEARARTAESMVTKNDDDLGAFVMALMKSFETLAEYG